jgi:putative DNA primase/helicase
VWLSDEIDPPGLLACPRGVLDLTTGEWLTHDSGRPITKCCPVDPGKESPLWTMVDAHLRKCLGDLYGATQRILGSALRGLGADRRVLWLHGPGGDGKSTLATIIKLALGQHAVSVPAEVFGEGGTRGAHGHELAAGMAGAKIAFALEVGMRLDWGKLKALSGGDEQITKRMHGKAFKYQRPPVLVLVSNDKPVPPDRAAAERLIVAGMLPPDDPDERLMEAAKSPGKDRDLLASACLQWLIEGCADFVANGLGPVPLCSHAPAGLERWWAEVVTNGTIIPNSGWSSVDAIRATLMTNEAPRDNELSAFLKTVVPFRRTNEGSRYGLTIRNGQSDS